MSESFDRERHPGGADNGEEVAAYALGALDAAEARAFIDHLRSCAICRDELAAFRGVVELLPLSVEVERASGGLRRRVLREVRADAARQAQSTAAAQPGVRPERPVARRPRLGLAFAGAIAALLIIIGGLGGFSGSAPRTIRAQVIGPGQASLKIGGGRAELVVAGLPAPPPGRIYEVWLARRNGIPVPTPALFSVTRQGRGDVMVPGNMHGVVRIMVTPEPAGGSRRPTRPPVIVARI